MSEATEVKAAVSEKVRKAMDLIATFTLKEAADLVKLMKDELGVEAAAPMAMAMPVAGGAAAAAEVEEVTEFDVILKSFGTQETKIAVVKEVRKITGLGLKEAKDAVEGAPQPILQKTDKKKAEETKKALEAVGAQVEIKPAA